MCSNVSACTAALAGCTSHAHNHARRTWGVLDLGGVVVPVLPHTHTHTPCHSRHTSWCAHAGAACGMGGRSDLQEAVGAAELGVGREERGARAAVLQPTSSLPRRPSPHPTARSETHARCASSGQQRRCEMTWCCLVSPRAEWQCEVRCLRPATDVRVRSVQEDAGQEREGHRVDGHVHVVDVLKLFVLRPRHHTRITTAHITPLAECPIKSERHRVQSAFETRALWN